MTEETKTATAGAEEKNQQGQVEEKKEPEVMQMTKDDYEKNLQSEADKRVQEALKTHRSKWEKEYKTKIEEERKDAERLAQLSAEEREKALMERQKNELSQKEKLLRSREMKLTAIDVLSDEGLPVSFADQLLGEDADDTYKRIQAFKQAWHDAIDKAVDERLKDYTPRKGGEEEKKADMNEIIRAMAKK